MFCAVDVLSTLSSYAMKTAWYSQFHRTQCGPVYHFSVCVTQCLFQAEKLHKFKFDNSNPGWCNMVSGLRHPPTQPPPRAFKQLSGNLEEYNLTYKPS